MRLESHGGKNMLRFQVTATRVFTDGEWKRTVQIPTFIVEASTRTQALLHIGTILHTTLTETNVSLEEV